MRQTKGPSEKAALKLRSSRRRRCKGPEAGQSSASVQRCSEWRHTVRGEGLGKWAGPDQAVLCSTFGFYVHTTGHYKGGSVESGVYGHDDSLPSFSLLLHPIFCLPPSSPSISSSLPPPFAGVCTCVCVGGIVPVHPCVESRMGYVHVGGHCTCACRVQSGLQVSSQSLSTLISGTVSHWT